MLDCIVLAGGVKGTLEQQEQVVSKALLRINGVEMIRFVLDAICALPQRGRVVVVGPQEQLLFLAEHFPVELVAEKGSILENILAAHRHLRSREHMLISSADIPLLTREVLEDFLLKCSPFTDDFYYPIISKEKSEGIFPGVKRTYVTLQEGTFTGGNVFLVNPAVLDASIPLLEQFLAYRKNPLKMVSLLGGGFIMNYLRKKLTLGGLEERISQLLKLKAKAVVVDYPQIGFDVDKEADLELVRQIMPRE